MSTRLSCRRSSTPALSNRVLRRPTLERKPTAPALLEITESIADESWNYNHQFEQFAGQQKLPKIVTTQQRMAKAAWLGDITKWSSVRDEQCFKLDTIAPKKLSYGGECLPRNICPRTKLCINSQHEAHGGIYSSLPMVSSYCHAKSMALKQFIENAEEKYDSHREKADLLHKWIIRQRTEWLIEN